MNRPPDSADDFKLVALTGNPNSGKTSLFNHLTGSHQRVGNWSGVTVERRDGWLRRNGSVFQITDLPGLYSLASDSPDESIARDFIVHGIGALRRPDVVVQVVDGGNLERSLFLTLQLIELEIPVVMALNMFDEVRRRGLLIDARKLSDRLGIAVVPTIGHRGDGVSELAAAIQSAAAGVVPRPETFRIDFDSTTNRALKDIRDICTAAGHPVSRGVAIGMLTGEQSAFIGVSPQCAGSVRERAASAKPALGDAWSDAITHARYAAISKLLAETVGVVSADRLGTLTGRLDAVLIHRVWGLPFFIIIMLLLFEATFMLGSYPMNWLDVGISGLADWLKAMLPGGFLSELLTDGLIRGMGFVGVFLPNILILLTGIHLLEDSGYMARAAFLMDRVMRLIGLHGRSFIPMLMGFGCNVPALLGARTLESGRDRILTMLLIPLMSCSARLPVYIMVTAAFFPRHGGLVIFGLYMLGSVAAVGLGRLFGKTILRGQAAPFMLELPPYRWPTLKTTLTIMRLTLYLYLKRIAGIVMLFAAAIWFLSSYPKPVADSLPASSIDHLPSTIDSSTIDHRPSTIDHKSYLEMAGVYIEPLMRPLGFTLPMDVALVSGFIAKEVVVATLGVQFTGSDDPGERTLIAELREHIPSPAVALAFLVFVLLYTPCLTTIVTLHREVGKLRWTVFSILYQTAAAYLGAWITLQVARWAGLG